MSISNRTEQIARVHEALLEVSSVGLAQLCVLLTVARSPGGSINEAAEANNLTQQTASRYIATLSGRYAEGDDSVELLRQSLGSTDPRRRSVSLTPQGEAMVGSLLDKLYAKLGSS